MPPDVAEWLVARAGQRHAKLRDRLDSIEGIRQMPDVEEIAIGSAKETRGAVLFADLVNSTQHAIAYAAKPENMLATLNVLIPTLMDCADWYDGEFEKNTGDGILVYFGIGSSVSDEGAAQTATFAAHAMLWSIKYVVNPELARRKLRPIEITVGADLGEVLLARIGIARGDNPLVAVGVTANRAAKIQERCQAGQFRVGEEFYTVLSKGEWRSLFRSVAPGMGWEFKKKKSPADIYLEKQQAQRDAERENEVRRLGARGSFSGVYLPATPAFVSELRPYKVYLYQGSV